MIAHLYRIRSDFRNVPDKIIIKAKAKENFPGTWLHAEVELPDFIRVAETEARRHVAMRTGGESCRVRPKSAPATSGTPQT